MTERTREEMLKRIDEIDAMFDKATGWGSWMVMAANEREALVNHLRSKWQMDIKHENLARTSDGRRVS